MADYPATEHYLNHSIYNENTCQSRHAPIQQKKPWRSGSHALCRFFDNPYNNTLPRTLLGYTFSLFLRHFAYNKV